MRTLTISGIFAALTIAVALWAQDAIPRTQVIPATRRTIQTTDGQTLQGGPTPTHAYTAPGTYLVTLKVTDNEGCSTALVGTGRTVPGVGSD